MADVSHTGTIVTVSASNTTGGAPVPITAFPKDTDPFDIPDMDVADAEVGTNGDLISWDVANPIEISMAVIPVTDDYEFLVTLLNLNRPEKNKKSAKDLITLVRVLPNGETVTLSKGKLIGGPPASALASSGKIKTGVFRFRFSKMTRTPALDIDATV